MPPNPPASAPENQQAGIRVPGSRLLWLSLAGCLVVLGWFYFGQQRYGSVRDMTAASWLLSAWNKETDYEHGVLFPFVIAGLIIYQFKALRAAAGEGSWWGLAVVLFGVLLYAAAFRTLQPRIAMGALPFIAWGGALYLWGLTGDDRDSCEGNSIDLDQWLVSGQ